MSHTGHMQNRFVFRTVVWPMPVYLHVQVINHKTSDNYNKSDNALRFVGNHLAIQRDFNAAEACKVSEARYSPANDRH
jgi:hypothetical protein